MPISNPILTINSIGSSISVESVDPSNAPIEIGVFWLNSVTGKIWVSGGTDSISDWIEIGANPVIDAASILNKILVQNGNVLTTDQNVLFED